MKVAFTTSDNIHVNAHFGWADKIALYEVNTEGYNLVETLHFTGELKEDGNEDKLVPKIEALTDCIIVYVSAIGGSAAARLIRKKITPIKANSEKDKITDILGNLVKQLKGNPPPWLRKALQQDTKRFDLEEAEELVNS